MDEDLDALELDVSDSIVTEFDKEMLGIDVDSSEFVLDAVGTSSNHETTGSAGGGGDKLGGG